MTLSAICSYWYLYQLEYASKSTVGQTFCMHPDHSAATDTKAGTTMDAFLAEVERKAFVIARISLRDDEDALDAVQDAMIRLVRTYASRPPGEWKPLFYRILKNRIVDQQRRRSVRQRFMAWLPSSEVARDPIEEAPGQPVEQPDRQVELQDSMEGLQQAIDSLPARQSQAFLLRAMEGLNVAETATAMGCSQGSVKTHYYRAVHSLRATLGEHWGEQDAIQPAQQSGDQGHD
jgi:RNA polymerase sigma-70 factor (ECF subfamily)